MLLLVVMGLVKSTIDIQLNIIRAQLDGFEGRQGKSSFSLLSFKASVSSERRESSVVNAQERKDGVPSSNSKQIICVRADQLLNITITKTGLDLVQRLSALFNDVYNKRLPFAEDDDHPMLALVNATGKDVHLDHFDGLEVRTKIDIFSLSLSFFSTVCQSHIDVKDHSET